MTNANLSPRLDVPDITILKQCRTTERDTDYLRRSCCFESVATARIRAAILIKAGLLRRRPQPKVVTRYKDQHRGVKYLYSTTEAGRRKLEELGEI